MRRHMFWVVMLGMVMLAGDLSAANINIKVYPEQQNVIFPVNRNGRVLGIVMRPGESRPKLKQIAEIWEQSDRIGYDKTVARGAFNSRKKGGAIANTCNDDEALWLVKLRDGRMRYLNSNMINITYDSTLGGVVNDPVKLPNGYIRYGNFQSETIVFDPERQEIRLSFGNNRITKVIIDGEIVYDLSPEDIGGVYWFSDTCGWFENSIRFTILNQDDHQNLWATIINMPEEDEGYVALKISSGPYAGKWAWFWVDEWLVSGADVDPESKALCYDFAPEPESE